MELVVLKHPWLHCRCLPLFLLQCCAGGHHTQVQTGTEALWFGNVVLLIEKSCEHPQNILTDTDFCWTMTMLGSFTCKTVMLGKHSPDQSQTTDASEIVSSKPQTANSESFEEFQPNSNKTAIVTLYHTTSGS